VIKKGSYRCDGERKELFVDHDACCANRLVIDMEVAHCRRELDVVLVAELGPCVVYFALE
jgi:hypothetical protein